MVNAPSSTRAPVGSVTTTSFPSSSRGNSVVIVTEFGALSKDAPAIGDVATSEFAKEVAGKMISAASATKVAVVRFIISSLFRL